MNGGFRKNIVENKRRLAVLAVVAALMFGVAYWLATKPAEPVEAPEKDPATEDAPAPLADTPVGDEVRLILKDESYQSELPTRPKPPEKPARRNGSMPKWLGDLIFYLFVGLGIFTVAVFVWILVTGARRPSHQAKVLSRADKKMVVPILPQHDLIQPATLADAEALAAAGQFGDAVRKLLSVALVSLARRELVRIRPSMTGREIVRSARLAPDATDALSLLVATVEAYAFAGLSVSADDYANCLQGCHLLAKTERRAA
ncbi:MAG: DUF4129 domain-containing protein [Alphaproteobacteria bacterium]|nr:MAG: DUF4129 domain-containing protein [Alphaproteobacteria bacterium]